MTAAHIASAIISLIAGVLGTTGVISGDVTMWGMIVSIMLLCFAQCIFYHYLGGPGPHLQEDGGVGISHAVH